MLYQAVVVIATSVYYKYLVDNRITSRKFKILIPIIIGTFSLAIIIYYLFESLQILFSFINN